MDLLWGAKPALLPLELTPDPAPLRVCCPDCEGRAPFIDVCQVCDGAGWLEVE